MGRGRTGLALVIQAGCPPRSCVPSLRPSRGWPGKTQPRPLVSTFLPLVRYLAEVPRGIAEATYPGFMLGYIIVGFIAGAIAKAIMPGKESGGWLATMLLGIGGAFVGGFVGDLALGGSFTTMWSLRGLGFSVLGAMLILAFQRWWASRK